MKGIRAEPIHKFLAGENVSRDRGLMNSRGMAIDLPSTTLPGAPFTQDLSKPDFGTLSKNELRFEDVVRPGEVAPILSVKGTQSEARDLDLIDSDSELMADHCRFFSRTS
jgi:hypothetical protein